MRIQHNIMAMNAYRNYTNNVSAMKKNLEKLSSGYKINRAGDDAAGLAISEKMRAQITGLETAQKNAKDGISLVQTAEGALTEVHDMLNRMVTLATQSANGTYDNETDRVQLQKELDQLRTEINRIADSSNFNGIKLLDGSLDADSTAKADAIAAADAAQAAADAAAADAPNATGEIVFGAEKKLAIHSTMATNNKPSTAGAAETVLETDYAPTDKPGFSITFNGMSHTFANPAANATTTAGQYVSITIADGSSGTTNDVEIKLSEKDIADAYQEVTGKAAQAGDTATADVIAKAAANYVKNVGLIKSTGTAVPGVLEDANGDQFTARADGDRLVFEIKGSASNALARVPNFTVKYQGVTEADVAAEGYKFTTGEIKQGNYGAGGQTVKVKVAYTDDKGVDQEVEVSFNSAGNANGAFTALENAIKADTTLNALFDVGGTAAGGMTLTTKDAASTVAVTNVTVSVPSSDTYAIAAGKLEDPHDEYTTGTTGYPNSGTPVTVQEGIKKIDQLASTVVTLDNTQVVDGAAIRLGDETYVFAIGEDSKYRNAENAVYVELDSADYSKAADGTITLNGGAGLGLEKVLDKLVEVAKDNKTFTVSQRATTGEIGLKQRQEVKDTTDMSTKDKLQSYIGITSVDKEKTAANTAAAVEAATAEAAKLQEKADELKAAAENAVDGKALTLQIGDTAETFNQLKVNIKDMHAAGMGIADIAISDQESAAQAVDVIKNAINYVSDVRGTLGATQNRLDHTINNLSVMTENIQDAESTIRDTDIASEMMAYTKNNILIQSAQAMLAQANQVPQGVLQLLQ